jgi:putative DNA primase/helicase
MSESTKTESLILKFQSSGVAAQRRMKAAASGAKAVSEQTVIKPAPAPEPTDDPSPQPELAQPKTKQDLVLSPASPYDTAIAFTEHECSENGKIVVWFWQGQFWRWNEKHYAPEPDEVIRGHIYKFLYGAWRYVDLNKRERFKPTPRHVNEVIDCLKSGLQLGVECQPPMWRSTRQPATDWIVFRNGVVNVLTGEMRQPSADLWVHSALGFDWDPDMPCPRWVQFLEEAFPGDDESKAFIEEWMGYCMTEETRFQKGAMLIGEKRSGKGTISHVLRQMVGDPSYVGLSFSTWTATENSGQCLIGKRVGLFSDVRLKPGRAYGQSYDPGGLSHVSAERLLNITGEDTVTLGRKNIDAWQGQLRLKIMLISNEAPNLNDAGGVLPSRFIKVHFGVSFFGREDVDLRAKLSAELPGIAGRCVRAYQHLCARGQFIQPATADELDRRVLAESNPFAAMALECFDPDKAGTVTKAVAYNRFERWCRDNGRLDILRTTPDNRFGTRLRDVAPFEHISDYRPHGEPRQWVGMRIRTT